VSLLHFTHPAPMGQWIQALKHAGKRIGFVPTMGALHEGHISLVHNALEHCDVLIVSIFVNPTQFNDPKDLLKYPKTLPSDVEMLLKCPCNAVFVPTISDIYPEGQFKDEWELGPSKDVLEGEFRPGHFDGVLTVVSRLFELVKPDYAFFGEKDFQQQYLIKKMAEKEGNQVKVLSFPTIRESNGLAMSSRNRRLQSDDMIVAAGIYKILLQMKVQRKNLGPQELEEWGNKNLNRPGIIDIEYLKVVKTSDLSSVEIWEENEGHIALLAAWVGGVRLLDNIFLD